MGGLVLHRATYIQGGWELTAEGISVKPWLLISEFDQEIEKIPPLVGLKSISALSEAPRSAWPGADGLGVLECPLFRYVAVQHPPPPIYSHGPPE